MKFLILLKKELRDLISKQNMITFGVMFFMLYAIGGFTGDIQEKAASSMQEGFAVLDLDKSEMSADMISFMRNNGYNLISITSEGQAENYIVIPNGFESDILNGRTPSIKNIATLKSLSIMDSVNFRGDNLASEMSAYLSDHIAKIQYGMTDTDILFTPVTIQSVTVVADKTAGVEAGDLIGALMNSSVIVPVIVMILTMLSAQMIVMAVSNEKTDKTLETLMSTPVSRMQILASKILSSAIIAVGVAVVFTLVSAASSTFSSGVPTGSGGLGDALLQLGLNLTPVTYALLGVDILLTVAIALCLAFILTIIAPDAKSTQLTIFPLMILTMLPYFLTIFTDINSLPTLPRVLMSLIPFTHTFTATSNILFGRMNLYLFGVLYQVLFLGVTLLVTVRIFSSDVIFTGVKLPDRKKKFGLR